MGRVGLVIDSTDFTSAYGVTVGNGTVASFMSMPDFKVPKSNNWHEYDGIEVDLSDPKFKYRSFQLTLFCDNTAFNAIISTLKSSVYHTIELSNTGGVNFGSCRLVSVQGFDVLKGLIETKLLIECDESPFTGFTPSAIIGTPPSGWILDNHGVSDYGVRILSGAVNAVSKPGAVKKGMSRDVSISDGLIYDSGDTIKLSSRDLPFTCLIDAHTANIAYSLYRNFIYAITRPNARVLTNGAIGYSGNVYYRSSKVTEWMSLESGRTWIKFTLTLTEI